MILRGRAVIVGALALRGRSSFGQLREPQRRRAAAGAGGRAAGAGARGARPEPGEGRRRPSWRSSAGDIQVVGTVTFHEDHFAVVGPLVAGRISRLSRGRR